MNEVPFVLTEHARIAMAHRGIKLEWVAAVLQTPARTEPDPSDPDLVHTVGRIPEFGGRVLRVIYNHRMRPVRIVTAFFDRSMRDKL
jgi:Domain of unknown function (DUF4258)